MGQAIKTAQISRKIRRSTERAERAAAPVAAPETKRLTAAWIFAVALCLGFLAYIPSLNGDFVFDDRNLPMMKPAAATWSLAAWLHVRPLLMASYYINYKTTGLDHAPYHVVNIFLHAACTLLMYYAVRRIIALAGTEDRLQTPLALFSAGLFLLHPIQTEAVSYIASRSEVLSVFFLLAAFCVFLYRRYNSVSAGVAVMVLALYGCAMSTKEHTAVLPAILLLTDYFWNPGFSLKGIRNNWKLYVPVIAAGAAGLVFVFSYVSAASNLGFDLKDFTWQQYLFTQFRVIFIYLRLFLLPFGQSVDWDLPLSTTIYSHGALFYGLALVVLSVAAGLTRKRYPLAAYGWFLTLILLAPTSSVMPIKDTLAERRLYLPFIGLALIVCEVLRRVRWQRRTMVASLTAVCTICAVLTWQRNGVWTDMETLWRSAYAQNPQNARAMMGLGTALAVRGQCAEALTYFEKSAAQEVGYQILFNQATAQDCMNQPTEALATYQHALYFADTAEARSHMALVHLKMGLVKEALDDLAMAAQLDPMYQMAYNYRGLAYLALGRFDEASQQFTHVLAGDPGDTIAIRGLDRAQNHIRQY